jgi:hypothetical protein
MLQVIFGDDEHTAADGPYTRLLKTRKWLYISSVATFALASGLYNEKAAHEAMKVLSLPSSTLRVGLVFGVSYLVAQYCLLLIQLAATYDIVLAERFVFRRADELAKARERLKGARKAEGDAVSTFRQNSAKALVEYRDRMQNQVLDLEKQRSEDLGNAEYFELHDPENADLPVFRHNAYRANAKLALLEQRLKEVADSPHAAIARLDPQDDADVQLAREELAAAELDLSELQRQVPSNRPLYRQVERLIDLTRVIPPLAVALGSLLLAGLM